MSHTPPLDQDFPHLAAEWDDPRNIATVTRGSQYAAWWKCALGHRWQAIINNRVAGSGCPYCSGSKVLPGFNDLATTHPAVAALWGDLRDITTVSAGSTYAACWRCPLGHTWENSIYNQVKRPYCPYCDGRKVWAGFNDLTTTHPQLIREWDNPDSPSHYKAGSNQKVHWKCERGHTWVAAIADRAQGTGCPYCTGKKAWPGFNDIATTNPQAAALWNDPARRVDAVTEHSAYKAHWICKRGHTWVARVCDQVKRDGCPYCTGRKVWAGFNDLATTHPDVVREWNDTRDPATLSYGSGYKALWRCERGHEWTCSVVKRVKGQGCPYCSGHRVLPGFNDLATTHPDVVKEWNDSTFPRDYVAGSNKNVRWKCKEGHEWVASIKNRTHGQGCPYCAGKHTVSGETDLSTTHPHLVREWADERPMSDVSQGSVYKAWWKCGKGHLWQATVGSRVRGAGCPYCTGKRAIPGETDVATLHPELRSEWTDDHPMETLGQGSNYKALWKCSLGHTWRATVYARVTGAGCPYCAGKRVAQGFNDLATTHSDLAREWADERPVETVSYGSKYKALWKCSRGHTWRATVDNRTKSQGCPHCRHYNHISAGEQELYEFIAHHIPGVEVFQSDRSTIAPYELDIMIPSLHLAFEFNGLWWHSEEQGKDKSYHRAKLVKAHEAGLRLIFIWEDMWACHRAACENMVLNALRQRSQQKINARQTRLGDISPAHARDFYNKHHIQGESPSSHSHGLYTSSGELVAAMGVRRITQRGISTYYIDRYATSCNVRGGFTKLLAHLRRDIASQGGGRIVSFSDNMISDGKLYENSGFTLDSELNPDYMYVVGNQRHHKFGYRLKRFRNDPELLFREGMTERELALLNNIPRVWDAGKKRWIMDVPAH